MADQKSKNHTIYRLRYINFVPKLIKLFKFFAHDFRYDMI